MRIRRLRRGDDLCVSRIELSVSNVLADCSAEQQRILREREELELENEAEDRRRQSEVNEKALDFTAVASIHEFRKKYGTQGFQLMVEEFIRRAPEFKGDGDLAKMIGVAAADLQFALEQLR